jgi:hypothetical protein
MHVDQLVIASDGCHWCECVVNTFVNIESFHIIEIVGITWFTILWKGLLVFSLSGNIRWWFASCDCMPWDLDVIKFLLINFM